MAINEFFDKIYEVEDLKDLELLLKSQQNVEELRKLLYKEFLKYVVYSCASEWNRAVRLVECFAIIGWGQYEPLQANRGKFINGDPVTEFTTADGKLRFASTFWSEGKYGIVIQPDRYNFDQSPDDPLGRKSVEKYPVNAIRENVKLRAQRNWICKNPIHIDLGILNHLPGSTPIVHSIKDELEILLKEGMRPNLYGNLFNLIEIRISFSYEPNPIMIVDDSVKLDRYEWKRIKVFNWRIFRFETKTLAHRYEIGPYRKNTGNIYSYLNLEKEFSYLHPINQKEKLTNYFITILENICNRLRKKYSDFNFDLMLSDFRKVMNKWITLPLLKSPYRFADAIEPVSFAQTEGEDLVYLNIEKLLCQRPAHLDLVCHAGFSH